MDGCWLEATPAGRINDTGLSAECKFERAAVKLVTIAAAAAAVVEDVGGPLIGMRFGTDDIGIRTD